jgi:hypothetical protein
LRPTAARPSPRSRKRRATPVGSDPATTDARKRDKSRASAVVAAAFQACSPHGSPAKTARRRRPLPRDQQRDGSRQPLPAERGTWILPSVIRRRCEPLQWRCRSYCLLGTHYHLLVETPEANLDPRHATAKRAIRAVVQPATRAEGTPRWRSLPLGAHRAGIARPRGRALHRPQSCPGGSVSVAAELAVEQLCRNDRDGSPAAFPRV